MKTHSLDSLEGGPAHGGEHPTHTPPPLTDEQLDHSVIPTLAARPPGPVHVFAYGSLMWNPSLDVEAEETATLWCWRRSYCLRSVSRRGSLQHPGRELSLQPGGCTVAVALRLPEDGVVWQLRQLWRREMVHGAYAALWTPVVLSSGATVMALSFVAKPNHPLNEADDSVPTVARLAAVAAGEAGSNADYVRDAARALTRRGLQDEYVDAVARAVDAQR